MGVSKNKGTPKSSILIRFSIINHPFWGTPIFGNTHMAIIINHDIRIPSLNTQDSMESKTCFDPVLSSWLTLNDLISCPKAQNLERNSRKKAGLPADFFQEWVCVQPYHLKKRVRTGRFTQNLLGQMAIL